VIFFVSYLKWRLGRPYWRSYSAPGNFRSRFLQSAQALFPCCLPPSDMEGQFYHGWHFWFCPVSGLTTGLTARPKQTLPYLRLVSDIPRAIPRLRSSLSWAETSFSRAIDSALRFIVFSGTISRIRGEQKDMYNSIIRYEDEFELYLCVPRYNESPR
jgi:hypothetical protein